VRAAKRYQIPTQQAALRLRSRVGRSALQPIEPIAGGSRSGSGFAAGSTSNSASGPRASSAARGSGTLAGSTSEAERRTGVKMTQDGHRNIGNWLDLCPPSRRVWVIIHARYKNQEP
jgi:hypothetical protein